MTPKEYGDLMDDIIRYETEGLEEDEFVEFFQRLVDTGLAWQLQGSYGRTAHDLIVQGVVTE